MPGIIKPFPVLVLLLFNSHLFAEDYIISLKDLTVSSNLKGYYVDSVINASVEDSCIGFVQKGMLNRQEPAFLMPGIATEVGNCLKRSFPKSDSAIPLIIRINHLYIYELTSLTKELSGIIVSISFITKINNGYNDEFLAGSSFEKTGLDVTGFHPHNIIVAFGNCFDDFSRMVETGMLHPQKISENDLILNPFKHPEKFAIFQKPHVRKGLFESFYSFRDCTPDTVTPFSVEYHLQKKDSARLRASINISSGLSPKKIYGFSDGKNIFVWAGSGFARVNWEENSTTLWVIKSDANNGPSSGVFIGTLLGGAIGGALAGLPTKSSSDMVDGCGKFTIDYKTGRIIPIAIPDYLRSGSITIIFLSKASAGDAKLTIIHVHDTLCTLNPGNYFKLSLPSKFRDIKLVFTGKDCISKEELFYLKLFNTDVYLAKIKRNKEIVISKPFEQVKTDILNGMSTYNTIVKGDLSQKPPVN